MENEELSKEVETVEDERFDALWDDENDGFGVDIDAEESEPETDAQPEEGEDTEETETEPEKQTDEEPEKKAETEDQRFKLKHNGEESEVDRDKVIELAQKGLDYDRIKEERDKLKADSGTMARLKAQESFLKELADSSEMTVDQLIEQTRVRMLMGKDENLTEEEALKKVREEANKATEKKETPKAEATPEERRQAMFANFLLAYPDLDANSIPKEVWEDASRTYDLVGAYQRHENRRLQAEIETLRQNKKNKERSTGSVKSSGSRTANQAFDSLWYDDDD